MADALRYHQAAFALLGVEPRFSDERREHIRALEARCGIAFPAAIVEWFALEDAETLFRKYTSTSDELSDLATLGDPEVVRQGYLYVATENQGVVAWYARLTGADDPPIYDNYDNWDEDLAQIPWRFCSATFSTFILHMLAVREVDFAVEEFRLAADAQAPDAPTFEHLRRHYTAGSHRERRSPHVYRFFNQHGRITIKCPAPGEPGHGTGHWTISAASPAALRELARGLWPFATLGATLRADSANEERRAAEQALLEQVRAEHAAR